MNLPSSLQRFRVFERAKPPPFLLSNLDMLVIMLQLLMSITILATLYSIIQGAYQSQIEAAIFVRSEERNPQSWRARTVDSC